MNTYKATIELTLSTDSEQDAWVEAERLIDLLDRYEWAARVVNVS